MALGSVELVKEGVLITRLSATEDAARMSVLCADKTGTITKNKLSVVDIIGNNDYKKKDVLLNGVLCSKPENADAIDLAFVTAYISETSEEISNLKSQFEELEFKPFNPKTRRTESIIYCKENSSIFGVTKGAFASLLELSNVTEEEKKNLSKFVDEFASKGYRTLAVAKCENIKKMENGKYIVEGKYFIIGLVAVSDLPREESKSVIEELHNLGIE